MTDRAKPNGAKSHQEMISGAYLRNAWYVAAWSDGVGDGQLVPRTIMDEPIVLYRKADGSVAAIEDRCAHRFAPLQHGQDRRRRPHPVPYHGLEYDGSGACVRNPHGTKNIPPRARVKSYPAIEKHKAVWVWMGDGRPTKAKFPTSACSTTCRSCTPPSATPSSSRPIISSSSTTCSI